MNRNLYEYCRGAKKKPRSESGTAIQQLIASALRSENPDDGTLLQALSAILSESREFDDDVFRILKPLHGCGGSEGYVLEVAPPVEAAFWKSLADRFPDHQGLRYLAADAALLAGDRDMACRLCMEGLRLDPRVFPPVAVDWTELLGDTEWYLEYSLHRLAQARDSDPEEMAELMTELTSEFADDQDKLTSINEVA